MLAAGGTAEAGAALTAGVPATAGAAGADFVNGTGLISLSFNPSTRSITFPASSPGSPSTATVIVVTGSDADTADESFTLHAVLAGGPDVTATGQIWALPTVIPAFTYLAPATVPESQPTVTFTATLAPGGAQPHDITIPVTTGAGTTPTATSTGGVNRDYTALPAGSKIVIPAGQLTGSIDVGLFDDDVYEGVTQNLKLVTGTPLGATGPASVEVGITDNDAVPVVTIHDAPAVGEGAPAVFPVTLATLSDLAVTVTVTTMSGADTSTSHGATDGTDYTAPAAKLTIPPLTRAADVPVKTTLDYNIEGTETFVATLSAPVGATLGTPATATGTITDDLSKPTVTRVAPTAALNGKSYVPGDLVGTFVEGASGERATFINLSIAATTNPLPRQLKYTFVDGTAKNGVDYRGTAGNATVPAGAGVTAVQIPVTIIGDRTDDPGKTFTVVLTSPNGTLNPNSLATPLAFTIASGGATTAPPATTGPTITAPATIDGARGVTITGTAGKGATVELWAAPLTGALRLINTGVAGATGKYAFLRWIGVGTRFQVTADGVSSVVKTVRINQVPLFAVVSGGKGKLTLTVLGNPAGSQQSVVVQSLANGKWVTAWSGVTGADHKWTATVPVKSKTSWTLRALVTGSVPAGINSGYSAAKRITVK